MRGIKIFDGEAGSGFIVEIEAAESFGELLYAACDRLGVSRDVIDGMRCAQSGDGSDLWRFEVNSDAVFEAVRQTLP